VAPVSSDRTRASLEDDILPSLLRPVTDAHGCFREPRASCHISGPSAAVAPVNHSGGIGSGFSGRCLAEKRLHSV